MDRMFRKQLYVWVYDNIKSNPQRFGGNYSNSEIMYKYLSDFYGDYTITEIEPKLMSILSTVSRIKNKLLVKNPKYDYRTKHKAKIKKLEKNRVN